ncbi:hypothetical protein OAU51_00350 [Porticoccaceae bacterium]|jgi:hypothetical protein|nr:hypothetical protein [Porticoccaceae bacterium]
MANKDAAFGLKATGKVGQNRDNQGLSEYSIAASATAIYQWDPVEMLATGTIGVAAAGDVLLGSLNGVFYTDASTSKPTWANHLEASNTATDIVGFVADDPYERFEIQSAGTVAQTNIGNCADIVYAAGATPNYISKVEISGTMAATAAQLKIIGVSKDPDNNELGAANANVIVTIAEHFLTQTAGI